MHWFLLWLCHYASTFCVLCCGPRLYLVLLWLMTVVSSCLLPSLWTDAYPSHETLVFTVPSGVNLQLFGTYGDGWIRIHLRVGTSSFNKITLMNHYYVSVRNHVIHRVDADKYARLAALDAYANILWLCDNYL